MLLLIFPSFKIKSSRILFSVFSGISVQFSIRIVCSVTRRNFGAGLKKTYKNSRPDKDRIWRAGHTTWVWKVFIFFPCLRSRKGQCFSNLISLWSLTLYSAVHNSGVVLRSSCRRYTIRMSQVKNPLFVVHLPRIIFKNLHWSTAFARVWFAKKTSALS